MKPRLVIFVFLSVMAVAGTWAASVGFSKEKIADGHEGSNLQTIQDLSLPSADPTENESDGDGLFRRGMTKAHGRTPLESKAHNSALPFHPQSTNVLVVTRQARGRSSPSGPSIEYSQTTSHRRRSWDARDHIRTPDDEPGPTFKPLKIESPIAAGEELAAISEPPREASVRKGEDLTAPSRISLELTSLSSPQGSRKARLVSRLKMSPDPLLDVSGLKYDMAAQKTGRKMASMKIEEGLVSNVTIALQNERNRQRRKRDTPASVGAESTDDVEQSAQRVPESSLAERQRRQSADKISDDDDDDDDDDIDVTDDDNDAGSKAYENDDLDDLIGARKKRGEISDSNTEDSDFTDYADQPTGFVQTHRPVESSRDKRQVTEDVTGTSSFRELTTKDLQQEGEGVHEAVTSFPSRELQATEQRDLKHHRSHRDKRQTDDDASDDDDDDNNYELEDESDFALERKKRLLKDRRSIRAEFDPFGQKGGEEEDPVRLFDQRDVQKFKSFLNIKQGKGDGPSKGKADNSAGTSISNASERQHVVEVTLKHQTEPGTKTGFSLTENSAPLLPGPVEAKTDSKPNLDTSADSRDIADNRDSLLPTPRSYELLSSLDRGLPPIIANNDELFASSYDAESRQIFENLRRIRQESMLDNEVFNSNQPLQQISGVSGDGALPSMEQIRGMSSDDAIPSMEQISGVSSDDVDPNMEQMMVPATLKPQQEVTSKLHKRHASPQLFGGSLTRETKPPNMVEGDTSSSNNRTEDGNVKTIIANINERETERGSSAESHQAAKVTMSSSPNGIAKSIDVTSIREREAVSSKVNNHAALRVSVSDRKAQLLDASEREEAVSSSIAAQEDVTVSLQPADMAYTASGHVNNTTGKVVKTVNDAISSNSATIYQDLPQNELLSLQQRPLIRFNASKIRQTAGKPGDEKQNGAKQAEDDIQSQIDLEKQDPADNKTRLLTSSEDKKASDEASIVINLPKINLSHRRHPKKSKKAKIDPCSNGLGSVNNKCEIKVQNSSTDNESSQTNVQIQKTSTGPIFVRPPMVQNQTNEENGHRFTGAKTALNRHSSGNVSSKMSYSSSNDKPQSYWQIEVENAEKATRNTSEDVSPNKVSLVELLTTVAQEIQRHRRSKTEESGERDSPSSADRQTSLDSEDPGAALDLADDGDTRVQNDDNVGKPNQPEAEARSYRKPDVAGSWDPETEEDQGRHQDRAEEETILSLAVGDSVSVQSSHGELRRPDPEASAINPVPRSQPKFRRSWLKKGDGISDLSLWDRRLRRQSLNIIKDIVDADDDMEEDDDDDDIENDDIPEEEDGVDLNTFQ